MQPYEIVILLGRKKKEESYYNDSIALSKWKFFFGTESIEPSDIIEANILNSKLRTSSNIFGRGRVLQII